MDSLLQNTILEKFVPQVEKKNNSDIFLKDFSNFFLISKFEESQNTSMVSKIPIGILFKMVYSIESHRKKKILALNIFFLQSLKKFEKFSTFLKKFFKRITFYHKYELDIDIYMFCQKEEVFMYVSEK